MYTVVVVIVFFSVLVAINVVLIRARRGRRRGFAMFETPRPLEPHRFDASRSDSFLGGARVGWLNVTFPGSRLTFDAERAMLRGWHRPVDIDRHAVACVRHARLAPQGISFDSADGSYDGVIFLVPSQPRTGPGCLPAPRLADRRVAATSCGRSRART